MRYSNNAILNRILGKIQMPDLVKILADNLSATDLQSLLLAVYKERAARLNPAAVFRQYRENRFTRLAHSNPAEAAAFDLAAYNMLPPGFRIAELSPVAPLGSCSVPAPVDQNNIMATSRNTEVCADATNMLALECAALRRKNKSAFENIKLCASHRLLRGQLFNKPGSFAHFRVLCLCTAGRDTGNYTFESAALSEHMDFYIRLLLAAEQSNCFIKKIRVLIIPCTDVYTGVLEERVMKPLQELYPDISINMDSEKNFGSAYYQWARFHIYCTNKEGNEFLMVDGGFNDWTRQYLNDKKERLLTSGLGSERLLVCFRSRENT